MVITPVCCSGSISKSTWSPTAMGLVVVMPLMRNLPLDRKSTRLNSSHTVIYTLSLHDALPIYGNYTRLLLGFHLKINLVANSNGVGSGNALNAKLALRSEERRVGKECRSLCDWSSDVCSSDLW